MNEYRTNTTLAGALYIVGTVSGILSLALSQPLREARDPLASAAANADQVIGAALCVLLMGLALVMVPVVMYPILRRCSVVLALGYVVFRGALETATYFVMAIAWLLLPALGRSYLQAGTAAAAGFQASGHLLLAAAQISSLTAIVFCLGALMFYWALYAWRLVPRWLSVWGLAAVVPYLAAAFLALSAVPPDATILTALDLPMALQEMVLAVWLIVKGVNSPAVVPGAVRAATNESLSAA